MKIGLKPLGDRVVVVPDDAETVSEGGIVIPDSAQEKPARGKVVAVGDGKRLDDGTRDSMCVQVGDEVVYGSFAGSDIEVDGQKVKVLREEEILAVLETA